YQGSCFAKQRVAVSIKLERSWVAVSRFGIGFRHIVGVVRISFFKNSRRITHNMKNIKIILYFPSSEISLI
ncbi:hypothetical protein, partial [Streptomyces sp. S1]